MKILFDYCYQRRAYADHTGLCLVEVEKGDNVEEIKKELTKPKAWYEQKYTFLKAVEEYTTKNYPEEKTYKGNLLLFATRAGYTG